MNRVRIRLITVNGLESPHTAFSRSVGSLGVTSITQDLFDYFAREERVLVLIW